MIQLEMATSKGKTSPAKEPAAEVELTKEEIDKRATSATPYFKLSVTPESSKDPLICYVSNELGLKYPSTDAQGNLSVVLRIVKLTKENGSDQEGYVISNPELEHSYLQVTDQRLGCDEKRVLKFTTPEQVEPEKFYESQLINLHQDPASKTKFAFYTTALDINSHSKVYYHKPEDGAIVAKEGTSHHRHHYFSLSMANELGISYLGVALTATQVIQNAHPLYQHYLVKVKVNGVWKSLYLLTGGNYQMRYRTLNSSDNSYVMAMISPTGTNPVYWTNYVTPSYYFKITHIGNDYVGEFEQSVPPMGFNVVGSPTTPTLLAFTTTSGTTNLYLSADQTGTQVDATSYTGSLPTAAYMFNVYEITGVQTI